jgi:hypothetical protein
MMKTRPRVCLWLLYAALQILAGTTGSSFAACLDVLGSGLPADFSNTVREIGAEKQLCRLVRTIKASSHDAGQEALALQSLNLKVLKAVMDIDYTIARIDNEIAQLQEVSFILASNRDSQLALVNLGNLALGTGTGAVGSSLAVPHSTAQTGNIIAAIAGTVATGLSIAAGRLEKGNKAPLGSTPAMLAQILGRQPDAGSKYPESVWLFLNTPTAETPNGQTWRQALISQWKSVGRLAAVSGYKAALLTANGSSNVRLGLDEIADRTAMLYDVRAKVALFKEDLIELIQYLVELAQSD